MNEFNDEQLDPTVDRLLQQAFAGRPGGAAGRGSLADVRQRARRQQRRRGGAMVGAAAVVGLGSVALPLSREDEPASTAGDDGVATSTTAAGHSLCGGQSPLPVATDSTVSGTWPGNVATTTTDGFGGAATVVFPTYTTVEWPSTTMAPTTVPGVLRDAAATSAYEYPTSTYSENVDEPFLPCEPAGQFRCVGNTGSDDQGYTYFEYCEPTGYVTTTTMEPTTSIGGLDAPGPTTTWPWVDTTSPGMATTTTL